MGKNIIKKLKEKSEKEEYGICDENYKGWLMYYEEVFHSFTNLLQNLKEDLVEYINKKFVW